MTEQLTRTIIVKSDVNRVYETWKNFENFPFFMKYIKSARKTGDSTSHWVLEGPLGMDIEWDAEMTRVDENKRIGWSTKDRQNGDITTSGQVTFNQLPDNQTEITVLMQYIPKGGIAGQAFEKLFGNAEKRLEEDLQNFKAYIEGHRDRTG